MSDLASGHQTTRRRELVEHFTNRFLAQPPEQIGGVKETIANYLQAFITPEIAQVFCPGADTFDFADIDRGKIICVAMPQKFQMERRYVNTFLKMLFYTHVLRRFDKPAEERRRDNLLILWADEAQRFVTASEDGMSDYNCIDVIREAQATVVAAAQSSTSFIPPLGREKARVFTLNLRNRLIFKAADEEGALESADFLGKNGRHQEIVGLLQWQGVPELLRAGRAQDKAPPATIAGEAPCSHRSLRTGTSAKITAADRGGWERLPMVQGLSCRCAKNHGKPTGCLRKPAHTSGAQSPRSQPQPRTVPPVSTRTSGYVNPGLQSTRGTLASAP